MSKLNSKQQLFVEHYLSNGGNGQQAALHAGYSAKYANRSASQLLKNPTIKKAIESQQNTTLATLKIKREDKIKLLWHIAKMHYNAAEPKVAIQAIAELNKMQGDYAPVKQETKQETTHVRSLNDTQLEIEEIMDAEF